MFATAIPRFSDLDFLEPVMRIGLIVEGLDFEITATAIQSLRFFERPIGLRSQDTHPKLPCEGFQLVEDAATDAEPARGGTDPHAFDLADIAILHFERAAAH